MKLAIEFTSLAEQPFNRLSIGCTFVFAKHKEMVDPYVQIKTTETQYCLLERFLDGSANGVDASNHLNASCIPFQPRSPRITKP